MITYTVSPNITFPKYGGFRESAPKLPTVKQILFFVTNDEYTNIQTNPVYSDKKLFSLKTLPPNPTLIRTNSTVEYECGIALNQGTDIHYLLKNLGNLETNCDRNIKQQYKDSKQQTKNYISEYHLAHNDNKAVLNYEQKDILHNHGFPNEILIQDKTFVLDAVGIDLSIGMINQPNSQTKDTKGKHIQIIYKNNENAGYLKFKKPDSSPPDPNATVSEISQFAEHDTICVNIHITKSSNNKPKTIDEQLNNIGQYFNYFITRSEVPEIDGYTPLQIENYFFELHQQFEKLTESAFSKNCNYNSSQDLYNNTINKFNQQCFIKVKKDIIFGKNSVIANIDFNNKVTQDFLSLGIHNEKLEAPLELNYILNYTPPPAANLLVLSDSEDESSEDNQVIDQNNDDVNALIDPFAALGVNDPAAQPIQIEAQILAIDNGVQDPDVALLAVPAHEVSENTAGSN